jgi:tyrosine-protein phosphatase SIW14
MRFSSLAAALLFSLTLASPARSQSSALAASPSPSSAERISLRGIQNAGRVTPFLYRGAQPSLADLSELKKLGVTTIVDLRGESASTSNQERSEAESLGIRFVHIPVGGFSAPSSAQLADFFSLLRASPPQTIFVHCEFGRDRTGVFIASYRIAFQHWSADQATNEMLAFGFNRFWHPSMTRFVRNLPKRLQSDPILKTSLPPQVTPPLE